MKQLIYHATIIASSQLEYLQMQYYTVFSAILVGHNINQMSLGCCSRSEIPWKQRFSIERCDSSLGHPFLVNFTQEFLLFDHIHYSWKEKKPPFSVLHWPITSLGTDFNHILVKWTQYKWHKFPTEILYSAQSGHSQSSCHNISSWGPTSTMAGDQIRLL